MFELTEFKADHARAIFEANAVKLPLPIEEMITVYVSPGSVALTLLSGEMPVACAGIISLSWHRGEAWLLTSKEFGACVKTAYGYMRHWLPALAAMGEFARVQATSFEPTNSALFEHLGFMQEGIMRRFGPKGENAILYSRIFNRKEAPCPQ